MIVVTGATGNIGRPLVRALAAAGERERAVSRNPAGEPLAGDLLSGTPAPGPLLDKAVEAGGRRVVALSSQAAGTRPEAVSHDVLRSLEGAVRASGLERTVLRPGGFFTNAYAHAGAVRGQPRGPGASWVSNRSRARPTWSRWLADHCASAAKSGERLAPSSVISYSTRGGTSAW